MAISPIQSRPIVSRPARAVQPPAPVLRPAAPAPAPAAPATPGFGQRAMGFAVEKIQALLVRSPRLNRALGHLSGPFIKQRFNAPAKPGAETGPAPLSAATIAEAQKIMAARFRPKEGKVLIGIAGGGKETVHAFVVSGVKPDGKVTITQALAQYSDRPEQYEGLGGWIRKKLDQKLGNEAKEMIGVVEDDWAAYARRSNRNSVVLLELDADPKQIEETLKQLKGLVGKPYDQTMLTSDPATAATEMAMYCTEISSWFVNRLRPGTIPRSEVSGLSVYQVADHMRATDVHGGPLKVLYNGQNRLDLKKIDPFPQDR